MTSAPSSPSDRTPEAAYDGPRRVALLIEIPILYTGDLDRPSVGSEDLFENGSDWLLACIAVRGPVKLRFEVDGTEVVEVWGGIREAQLVEPTPGMTDEKLCEEGERLLPVAAS